MIDETMMQEIAHTEACLVVEPVAAALWGPKNSELEGGRDESQGITHKVDHLYEQSINGGLPARISAQSFDRKTKLQVAALTGTFTLAIFVAGAIIA